MRRRVGGDEAADHDGQREHDGTARGQTKDKEAASSC